jgi:hypothetical protein
LPPAPTSQPQAALDAYNTSGIGRLVQNAYNHGAGAVLGEAGKETNAGAERLNQNTAATYALLTQNGTQRSALWDRMQQEGLFPHPGDSHLGLTGINAEQQMHNVNRVTNYLRQTYADIQKAASQPGLPEEQVAQAAQKLGALRQLIARWEEMPDTPQKGYGAPEKPLGANRQPMQQAPAQQQAKQPAALLDEARAALAKGAPKAPVYNRLRRMGVDPAVLDQNQTVAVP